VARLSISDKVGVQFIGQVTAQVCQMLGGIILVRLLTRESFATYGQTFLVFALLLPLLGNLGGGIAYFLPRLDRGQQKAFVTQSVLIGLAAGVVAMLGILLAADWAGERFHNPDLAGMLRVFCLFPFLTFPAYFFGQFMVSVERNVLGTVILCANAVVYTLAILVTLLLGASLEVLLVVLLVHAGLVLAVAVGYAGWFFRDVRMQWDGSLIRRQMAYAVPVALAASSGILSREMDKLVISTSFLPAMAAVYFVGAREVPVMSLIGFSISSVLLPEMSREHAAGNLARVRELWAESMRKQAMVALPTFVFLMAFAEEFIVTLYGRDYAASATVFRVYLCILPFRCIMWTLPLSATGHTRPIFWGSVLALVANVAVALALTPVLGMPGPAVATVTALVLLAAFFTWQSRRSMGLNPLVCFPWRAAAEFTAAAMGACLCVLALKYVPLRTEYVFALAAAGFGLVLLVVFLRTRLLTDYERATLKRWVAVGVKR